MGGGAAGRQICSDQAARARRDAVGRHHSGEQKGLQMLAAQSVSVFKSLPWWFPPTSQLVSQVGQCDPPPTEEPGAHRWGCTRWKPN